jgi:type II secretion system protein N
MALHFGHRARLVLRYVGIVIVGLLTFFVALQLSFPYDRVKDRVIEAASGSYDMTVGSVERGWIPGRLYFKAVTLRTRATKPDDLVTTFYIDKLEVDAHILAVLSGKLSVSFDAKIGAGYLSGDIVIKQYGKGDLHVALKGRDLPSADLPMRVLLGGLPMSGKLELDASLDLPKEKNKTGRAVQDWSKAEGSIELACPSGCTIGDGKAKLKPLLKNERQQMMVQSGIDFGKLTLDALDTKVELTAGQGDKNGKLEVTKFDAKSQDGEIHVDFMMAMQAEPMESLVTGCLRFKGSDSLEKREPKTFYAITTSGAERRADGLFHIKLTDKLKDMKRLNLECGPNAKGGPEQNFGGGPHVGARPNLTVTPEEGSGRTVGVPTPRPAGISPPPPPPPIAAPARPEGSAAAPPAPPPPAEGAQPGTGEFAPAGSSAEGSGSAAPASP